MINQNMTMEQLLDDFREKERKVREMDFNNLSEEDLHILSEYAEEKQFFSEIGNSLDYVVAATPFINEEETNTLSSLMERKDCLEALRNLSNDNDKEFIHFIYIERYQADKTQEEQREREQLALCRSDDIYNKVYRYEPSLVEQIITVAAVAATVDYISQEMDKYDIDRDDIYESTMDTVAEFYEKDELNVFYVENKEDVFQQKEAENVVIVESSDGYAMPTSANLDNPVIAAKFFEKVQGDNEIVNTASPRETTIDTSLVGGNVKLEVADDIGTIEKGDGVPSYEDKEAMEDMRSDMEQKSYETDNEEKSSQKRNCYERD